MRVYLQCWHTGKLTINLEVTGINSDYKIVDLLNVYYNQIIRPGPSWNPSFTWEYCYPKMILIGPNDIIYDHFKTLAEYGIGEKHCFTVGCGFSY